jgi:hypothetical protein
VETIGLLAGTAGALRTAAEEEGHPQAGDRDGPGESRLGIYETPRRPSDRIEDRDRTNDGGEHPGGGRNRACAGEGEEAVVEAIYEDL